MPRSKKPKEKKKKESAKKEMSDEEKFHLRVLAQKRKEHEDSVKKATEKNKKRLVCGKVRCAKQPHYRVAKGIPKEWPKRKGFKNISVCSGANGIWKTLSPMKLGPIEYETALDYSGEPTVLTATNLENMWQFSKVWEGDVDEDGKIRDEWFQRREKGWADPKAHRWVKKGNGPNRNIPLFSYWQGERLSYIEARKKIYCPLYAELVSRTEAYKKIKEMIEEGVNIQIIGYDGYDFKEEGKTLLECINDDSRPFGHELVLTALLCNEKVWEM